MQVGSIVYWTGPEEMNKELSSFGYSPLEREIPYEVVEIGDGEVGKVLFSNGRLHERAFKDHIVIDTHPGLDMNINDFSEVLPPSPLQILEEIPEKIEI